MMSNFVASAASTSGKKPWRISWCVRVAVHHLRVRLDAEGGVAVALLRHREEQAIGAAELEQLGTGRMTLREQVEDRGVVVLARVLVRDQLVFLVGCGRVLYVVLEARRPVVTPRAASVVALGVASSWNRSGRSFLLEDAVELLLQDGELLGQHDRAQVDAR